MRPPHRSSKPLYRCVADDLTACIEASEFAPGEKLPSERLLCERYGVSQITVRRALRELTYEGCIHSRHGLGWFVNAAPTTSSTHQDVTLVVSELDWLTSSLVRSLSDELGRARIALRLAFTSGRVEEEREAVAAAVERKASAFMLVVSGQERDLGQRYGRLLDGVPCPVVLLRHQVPGVRAPTAVLDEEHCVAMLAQHILALGHQRVVYAGPDPSLVEGQRRYQGFASTLWERGLELPLDWIFSGSLTADFSAARFRNVFGQSDHPTALVCASDMYAVEAMALLSGMGLHCPDDVAVVGVGDREFAPLLPTPLTTVRLDVPGLARASAGMIVDLLAGRPVENVRVTGELVTRQSCGSEMWRPLAQGAMSPGSS